MGEEPRPVRIEWRLGMSLTEYAARWVDMMPHIDALTEYAKDAHTVVEFGMRGGVSTWALLRGLPAGGRVTSVDIDEDVLRMTPPWVLEDERLDVIIGNDLTVGLPDQADLVVIDSGHEYQQTLDELERAAGMAPERIALHDYLYAETPGVRQAVDEFASGIRYRLATVHPSEWGLAVLVATL
jgi:predicted O-methyltransferase YrrM